MTIGRFDFAGLHEMIDALAELGAFTIAEPADACRQALESYFLARQMDPAVQNLVVGEQFQNEIIGDARCLRISGQGRPSEGPSAFAEHRPNIGRNESREVVRILHAAFESHRPDVVAVVEGDGAALLHIQHGLNVNGHRFDRACDVALADLTLEAPLRAPVRDRAGMYPFSGSCALVWSVSTSGIQSAAHHFRQNVGAVADKPTESGWLWSRAAVTRFQASSRFVVMLSR